MTQDVQTQGYFQEQAPKLDQSEFFLRFDLWVSPFSGALSYKDQAVTTFLDYMGEGVCRIKPVCLMVAGGGSVERQRQRESD